MTEIPQGIVDQGLDKLLNLSLAEAGPDRVVMTWTIGPEHLQPYGIVHGGVYCAVVESSASIGAALWLADRGKVVGVANHTDFLCSVTEGDLTATATPIHRGRSQQLWQVDIVDDRGRRIARGELRLQNLTG